MNDLEKHLNLLASSAELWGAPPSWSRVLFVEEASVTHGAPSLIARSSLLPMADYAARFDTHLAAGHAWVNMNAAGVLGDDLLVVIELPRYQNSVPRDKVSVNFSGPAILDGEPQWDASKMYRIVEWVVYSGRA
jgi:hypothetical protein